MSDREIDTSDSPELTEAELAEMERGRFCPPARIAQASVALPR